MSIIQVHGLHPLKGEIGIQGSKNAVLPMMAASILHRGTVVLTHVPRIQDVLCMKEILEYMGCVCTLERDRLTIQTDTLSDIHIPENYLKAMRSSIMMLGGLLGRCGEAITCHPGGCSIGKRPIDLHLYALRKLGAVVEEEGGVIRAKAKRLTGGEIVFSFPSVGATENALLAAVLAKGVTVIRGAAREPEIEALCRMLNSMGAKVTGGGTEVIQVKGVTSLHDTTFEVPGDRIAAGTYLSCIIASQGEAVLEGICPGEMAAVLKAVREMGAEVKEYERHIGIAMKGRPRAIALETEPYPGFPTDLQSPALSLLSIGDGIGCIRETIFEGRFATAFELGKMGAEIRLEGERAFVTGTYPLTGCPVEALDLRGGAALVVAGLAAEGDTTIRNCSHILRGYEDICRDLQNLGADIRRIL